MDNQVYNYIGGKWIPAQSGRTFETRNLATGEVIAQCSDSGVEDVRHAVTAAREAFESWRRLPAPRRGELLYRIAERLVHEKESLAQTLTSEMGKVLVEARGDVQEAIDMAYYMGGEGRRQFGHITPAELPNKSAWSIREPLGVVGLITPWNFPSAIPAWKSFPALIMSNTVVLKPSPDTPFTAALLVKVLEEAGLPPGVVNLVMGSTPQVGEALVKHPDVAAHFLHRLNGHGRKSRLGCRDSSQKGGPGNGWQERHPRHGGCGSGVGRRRHRVERLRYQRATRYDL